VAVSVQLDCVNRHGFTERQFYAERRDGSFHAWMHGDDNPKRNGNTDSFSTAITHVLNAHTILMWRTKPAGCTW